VSIAALRFGHAPLSLATTRGITVVLFSCGYLDVSVPRVCLPRVILFARGCPDVCSGRVPPFGYLRIWDYLRLPAAFRSLSRPSSPSGAGAFPLRS
jgi:hypothetical protein